jgi:hypothetical protein
MERLQLPVSEFELMDDVALASVSLNPTFRWCKFVLTDDQPNANKHRIPQDEFDNLIRTGINAPIKMAANHIADGHENAYPLGVITSLQKSGNKILGLAALWAEERKDDVDLIKKHYDEGQPVNLSWEVLYSSEDYEDDVKVLKGTVLRATTFVGLPAYQGRTPILQVASTEGTNLELEQALEKITELEASLETLKAELDSKSTELESVKAEKEELASFKATIEAEKEKDEKLAAIKTKFKEAGIEKEEKYFEDNAERLIAMPENDFDFMLQELVSFAANHVATSSTQIPNFNSNNDNKLTPKEIARKLRENK